MTSCSNKRSPNLKPHSRRRFLREFFLRLPGALHIIPGRHAARVPKPSKQEAQRPIHCKASEPDALHIIPGRHAARVPQPSKQEAQRPFNQPTARRRSPTPSTSSLDGARPASLNRQNKKPNALTHRKASEPDALHIIPGRRAAREPQMSKQEAQRPIHRKASGPDALHIIPGRRAACEPTRNATRYLLARHVKRYMLFFANLSKYKSCESAAGVNRLRFKA